MVVLAAGQEASPVLKNYKPVTARRLLKPEDGDWLMIRRTYDGWGYSPLTKINTGNVSRLKPVWMIETGEARVHESAPVVNSGVMFVTTPNNQVIALDAKTGGEVLWRTAPETRGRLVPHDTNRGVALYGNKEYSPLAKPLSSRSMRRPAKRSDGETPTTSPPTTSRSRRSWPTARSWSGPPAANTAFADLSRRSTPTPGKRYGARSRFQVQVNQDTKPGRRVTNGNTAARRSG
jgi:hypothetical protein